MADSHLLQRFAEALAVAFPSRADLARAVAFGLDANLNRIAPEPATLDDTVFALLLWAEARDKLGTLLAAARAANPANAALQALGTPWAAPDASGAAGGRLIGMPYEANPGFTGREDALAVVHTHLQAGEITALTGTGGIGKTQVAVEYAYRHRAAYPDGVAWLRMDPPAGIAAQVAGIGGPDGLNLAGWDAPAQEANVALVRRAWDQSGTCLLLIFDNLEDPALLAAWRPKPGSGSRVLLTSRYALWAGRSRVARVPLAPLRRAAGRGLLLGELARAEGRPVAALLAERAADPAALTAVDEICEELGDLPLGLALAGAYLAETGLAPAAYLARLRAAGVAHASLDADLVEALPTGHAPSIAATFALNYDQLAPAGPPVAPEDPLALSILQTAAAGAPAPIPWRLLARAAGRNPDDPVAAEDAAGAGRRLAGLGWLEPWPADAVNLHRLPAAYVRARAPLSPAARAALEQALGDELAAICDAGYPQAGRAYLAHGRHRADPARAAGDAGTAWLLDGLARLLELQGDGAAARPLYERALALREAILGADHLDTAQSFNHLGSLLHAQGEYAAARPLYERALAINESALGPDHYDTIQNLDDLGTLLRAQGEYAAARPLLERVLAWREARLGPTHRRTASSLNHLAILLQAQGEYAAARPLYERALAITEGVLGPAHPDTATRLNNLALLLQAQGKYAAARPLYERALAIDEAALGPDHPDTATDVHNLATLLHAQGEYAAARPLYERALAVREAALGPGHPQTARSLAQLAELLQDQGEYAAARPLYERALAVREATLGPAHPDTAESLSSLAVLLKAQGEYAAARPLYERALAIDEAALGPQHPDTATDLNNLATLLKAQGEYAAARPLLERALAIAEAVLGPEHPDTAVDLHNLGRLLAAQGEYAAARPLLERALAVREAVLGPTHPLTALNLGHLAEILQAQGEYAAARPLLERALAINEAVLGSDHPDTCQARAALAACQEAPGA